MDVLEKKAYKFYAKLSRYSSIPYYYQTLDNKYVYGTCLQLNENTPYKIHKVKQNDTYDSLALQYYNNPTYYWIICDFNRVQDPFTEPEIGIEIKIPTMSTIEFQAIEKRR